MKRVLGVKIGYPKGDTKVEYLKEIKRVAQEKQ